MKYTFPEWESSKKSWTDFALPGHEIDIHIWSYFRDVVPPIWKQRGFLCSEPYGRNHKGQVTYMAFVEGNKWDVGKYFYVGIISAEEFNRKYITEGEYNNDRSGTKS